MTMVVNQSSPAQRLSNEVLHQLFAYLDDRSLLAATQACRSWNVAGEDPFFWTNRLTSLGATCSCFCSCSSRAEVGAPSCPPKRAYFKVRMPEGREHEGGICRGRPGPSSPPLPLARLTPLTRSLAVPALKVVLFGPGLENCGADFVQDVMWGESSPLTTLGMFPSAHGGIGGGLRLAYKDHEINMVTLYRASQKERQAMALAAGPRLNKIIDSEYMLGVSRAVVADASAFIYLCDPEVFLGEEVRREFEALIGAAPAHVPLLLIMPQNPSPLAQAACELPLVPDRSRVTCLDYVEALRLTSLGRRWWATGFDVKTSLRSLELGLDWLLAPSPSPSPSASPRGMLSSLLALPYSSSSSVSTPPSPAPSSLLGSLPSSLTSLFSMF